jgi:hypothetical protein
MRVSRICRFRQRATLDRKGEIPMEITAKVTVIMAIVSFGFLAAVILGLV